MWSYPVRAGLVRRVQEWPWSSYRATAGLRKGPAWLDTHWLLGQFGEWVSLARSPSGRGWPTGALCATG